MLVNCDRDATIKFSLTRDEEMTFVSFLSQDSSAELV